MRNTTIRTRKIRGVANLVSSISIAARGEGPEGIANDIRCGEPVVRLQYGTVAAGKKRQRHHFQSRNRLSCIHFVGSGMKRRQAGGATDVRRARARWAT